MSIDWIPSGPVRAIPAKEMGNRGLFPSSKVPGGIVEYESCLERDFFLVCDHAPDVQRFQHQPVTIAFEDAGGKARRYTPDVYVEFKSGMRGLYEIKYEEEVANNAEKYEQRWKEARAWAKNREMIFSVLTEAKIRTPRWFNIWFTLGASKCSSNNGRMSDLASLVPEEGARYNNFCQQLAEVQGEEITKAAQVLCYAIYHGLVFVDSFSTQHLAGDTIIRKKRRDVQAPFKPLWDEIGGNLDGGSNGAPAPVEGVPSTDPPITLKTLKNLSFNIPLKYEERVNSRLQVINAWLGQPSKRKTLQWRGEFCKARQVSEKTIYNWISAYEKNGVEGLIPNHKRSGRRPAYKPAAFEAMEKARQYFLAPLISLKKAYEKLGEFCKGSATSIPTVSSFKAYIYKNTTASELARKKGIKYHKTHFTPSLASFQGACAPLQVVQMDNTSFDVFPVDSEAREVLPAPFMTAAIDCYTRMVAGFGVSYFPSSAQTVLEVLVQSILPKHDLVNTFAAQQEWPVQGFPVLLLVDNGMDYRSQALRDFCAKYNLIVEYAPVRTPRYKAFIEQWFNVLHAALVAEDVAGTRPPLKDRLQNPDLQPEADAVLTLQEVEQWLHQWVVDEYHFTNPYGDRTPAPFLRWQEFRAGRTGIILPSPREPPADKREVDLLYLSALERHKRSVRPDGVVWEHLKYNSRELGRAFESAGSQEVAVLLDRRDVRCVWVLHPVTNRPLKVGLASGWAQVVANLHGDRPIEASAWVREVALLKGKFVRQLSPYAYQKEMSRIHRQELLSAAKQATKSARKAREKEKESTRKGMLKKVPGSSEPGSEMAATAPTDERDSSGSEHPAPKKEIDWARIKPAGKRYRDSE